MLVTFGCKILSFEKVVVLSITSDQPCCMINLAA